MAKKTLEARMKMIDETQAPQRAAARAAEQTAMAYDKLDKAMGRAARRSARAIERTDVALQRQHIANLEREVQLGRKGAGVDLERARATRQYAVERQQLMRIVASELTLDHQKAAALRQLTQLERLHAQEMARAGQIAGGRMGGAFMGMGGRLGALATTYLGYRSFGDITGRLGESTDQRIQFQHQMTDLLGLGSNAMNIDAVTNKVLSLSEATGRAREEIAQTLFFIQSGTAGMADHMREEIERNVLKLGRISTANLETQAEALIKGYRIFGHEVGSVDEFADKLHATVERAFITHQQLAQFMVQSLSAGEAFGFKLNEILAAISVSTKSSGNPQMALTALRNIILRLNNAEKEGIQLTGDLANQLQQLSQVDPNKLTDMFGDRTVAVLFDLVRRTKELREETAAMADTAGLVDQRVGQMAMNFGRSVAQMTRDMKVMQENLKMGITTDPTLGMLMATMGAEKTAVMRDMPVAPEWMQNMIAAFRGRHGGSVAAGQVLIDLARQRLSAGDVDGARNALQAARGMGFELTDLKKDAMGITLDSQQPAAYVKELERMRAEIAAADQKKRPKSILGGLTDAKPEDVARALSLPEVTPKEVAGMLKGLGVDKALKGFMDEASTAMRGALGYQPTFLEMLQGKKPVQGTLNDAVVDSLTGVFGDFGGNALAALFGFKGKPLLKGGQTPPEAAGLGDRLLGWLDPSKAAIGRQPRETVQLTEFFQGLSAQQRGRDARNREKDLAAIAKNTGDMKTAIDSLNGIWKNLKIFNGL